MRKRFAAAAAALVLTLGVAAGQCGGCPAAGTGGPTPLAPGFVPLGGFAQPMPPESSGTPFLPDPAALERLNLKIDWVGTVPVGGGATASSACRSPTRRKSSCRPTRDCSLPSTR